LFPIEHEIYRFRLEALEETRLPPFKGSALRGAFGHALKRVVCALRNQECPTCLVRESCTYQRVFETRVDPAAGPKTGVDVAPHPYVLVPPIEERTQYAAGEPVECTLLLMGPALGVLPYLVYAFQELGRRGITVERKPLGLRQVEGFGPSGWEVVYDEGAGVLRTPRVVAPPPVPAPLDGRGVVELLTPLRVKERGRFVNELDLRSLLLALWRRSEILARYYGGASPAADEGPAALFALAEAARVVKSETTWKEWTRYSNRQGTKMQLGGVVGRLVLEGDLEPLAPWLAWGERFHVGKATSFGLGKIRVLTSTGEQG